MKLDFTVAIGLAQRTAIDSCRVSPSTSLFLDSGKNGITEDVYPYRKPVYVNTCGRIDISMLIRIFMNGDGSNVHSTLKPKLVRLDIQFANKFGLNYSTTGY